MRGSDISGQLRNRVGDRLSFAVSVPLFAVLATALFGWHAFHGGFYVDDWLNASRVRFHPGSGFWGAVNNYQTPSRPIAAIYVTLTYKVFGLHFHEHLVWSLVLAALLSAVVARVLQEIGVRRIHALGIGVLLLAFPWSDSTRFWSTGSQISLFIAIYGLGLLVALRGIRREPSAGAASRVCVHAVATALFVVSVLGYEVTAPAAVLSVALYVWKGGVRGAAWRFAMDGLAIGVALERYSRKFGTGKMPSASHMWATVERFWHGGQVVLAWSVVPVNGIDPAIPLTGLTALVVGSLLLLPTRACGPDERRLMLQWDGLICAGVVFAAIGYVMFVPAPIDYSALGPGVDNRPNSLAAVGFVIAAYAAAMQITMVASVGLALLTRNRITRSAIGLAMFLLVVAGYTIRLERDGRAWDRAAAAQAQVLRAIPQDVQELPAVDATLYVYGASLFATPSVPVFVGGGTMDLYSAVKLVYGTPQVAAFTLERGFPIDCGATTILLIANPPTPTPYGRAVFVDARDGRRRTPADAAECRAIVDHLPDVPEFLLPDPHDGTNPGSLH